MKEDTVPPLICDGCRTGEMTNVWAAGLDMRTADPCRFIQPPPSKDRYDYCWERYKQRFPMRAAAVEARLSEIRRDMKGRASPSSVVLPRDRAGLPVLRQPNLDLIDAGTEYQVQVDLPGTKKEDIAIELTPDSIEISAESTVEKEESKEGEYLFRERGYSAFKRVVPFPEEILPDKAEAKFEDGVLEVVLPKKKLTPAPKRVKLELK